MVVTLDTNIEYGATALLDSGCEGSCIDTKFVKKHNLNVHKLPRPLPVYNADGTPNLDGCIEAFVALQLKIGSHIETIDFGVTNLGQGEIFLGHDWLKKNNPNIDWCKGLVEFSQCPSSCQPLYIRSMKQDSPKKNPKVSQWKEDETILIVDPNPALNIRAKTNVATELAIKEHDKKQQKSWQEIIPEYLHDFPEVFTKQDFNELPPHCPWDHAIELLPGTKERLDCKIYPLSQDEQEQLDEFLEEHLRTGRIRSSKSPMASPFFFVKKKMEGFIQSRTTESS